MTGVLRVVGSVEDLFRLAPLDRLLALINGDGFDPALRAEPIVFDISDPIYGYGCAIEGCRMHSTQAGWWCTGHANERHAALRAGVGEAAWRAAAVPASPLRHGLTDREPRPACRFVPTVMSHPVIYVYGTPLPGGAPNARPGTRSTRQRGPPVNVRYPVPGRAASRVARGEQTWSPACVPPTVGSGSMRPDHPAPTWIAG